MERLFIMDKANYDPQWPRTRRPSVRAIIRRGDKLAMVHSLKYDYYKTPGGGLETGESDEQALIREVMEETGLTVVPESIRPFGSVLRLQRDDFSEQPKIFEQENRYYQCETVGEPGNQHLDEYEADEHFTLEYVTVEMAIRTNRTHDHGDVDSDMMEREARVLEMVQQLSIV